GSQVVTGRGLKLVTFRLTGHLLLFYKNLFTYAERGRPILLTFSTYYLNHLVLSDQLLYLSFAAIHAHGSAFFRGFSLQSGSLPNLVCFGIGLHDVAHQTVTHYVFRLHLDETDPFDIAQGMQGINKAGFLAMRQVDL